jgi:uncharacterized RDD family membrane protein YckC
MIGGMAKLIVNPTSSSRREIPLSRTLMSIGRDPSNDVVLPDAMVSRRHAVIECRGSHYYLRDCNSSNGSLVNGDRVSERGLRDGDLVAIGTARLLFREEEALEEAAGKVVQHPSAPRLQCPACQSDYRKGDLFCRHCGVSLAPAAPPKVVCSSCGTAVPLPARFCNLCGTRLPGQPAGEQPQAARPASGSEPQREAASVASDRAPEPSPPRLPSIELGGAGRGGSDPSGSSSAQVDEPRPLSRDVVSMPAGAPAVATATAPGASPLASPAASRAASLSASRVESPEPAPALSPAGVAASSSGRPAAIRPFGLPAPQKARALPTEPAVASPVRSRPEPPPVPSTERAEPAGFGRRLAAALIDGFVIVAVHALLLAPAVAYWRAREPGSDPAFTGVLLSVVAACLAVLFVFAYYVYYWGVRAATPGKAALGLAIEGDDGVAPIGPARAAVRLLGYLVSGALFGAGFLMIAFGGRGLHDRLAGTRVVRRRRA